MRNKKGEVLLSGIFAVAGIITFLDVLLIGTFQGDIVRGVEIILGVVFIVLSIVIQLQDQRIR